MAPPPTLPGLVQRGLERLYRIETELDVRDFLIDAAARDAIAAHPARSAGAQAPMRAPREQLLVSERDGDLELALFLDERVLANLRAHDPRAGLDDRNLADFLLAVEGVSHFVYLVWRARHRRPVSALELELQAEVDKYVTCLLTLEPQGPARGDLRARLFDRFEWEPDLAPHERERYQVANENARAYAAALDARFVARGGLADMLAELRRFYRMSGPEKLAHIAQAA